MRILGVSVVEDEFWATKLASDHQRLCTRSVATQTAFHAALYILLVMLQVTNLNSISYPGRCIFICLDHLRLTASGSEYLLLLILFFRLGCVEPFKLLLHLDLKLRHGVPLKLPWIQLAGDAEAITCIISRLHTKNHEHVYLYCLGNVIVRQVNGLQCLAFR